MKYTKGDIIPVSDPDNAVEVMTVLAQKDIWTDFLYEYNGQKGLWLLVTKGGTI